MNAQSPAIPAAALENADALRWIADNGPPASVTALARHFDRDPENFRKSMKKLARDGLLVLEPALAITDSGQRVLQALDLAEGRGGTAPAGFITLTHAELEPDPNNPRREFKPEDLAELEDGIVEAGRILQNLGVRPPAEPGGKHRIKYGERRWRAVGRLIDAGRVAADFPIPVEVRDASDFETLKEAIAENDQRAGLNRIERAQAYESLASGDPPMENPQIAALVKRSVEFVQQHRRLLRLPEDVQAMVAAEKLSLHEALKLVPTSKKAAAAERVWEPQPLHLLRLVEIAHKMARAPSQAFPGHADINPADLISLDKQWGDLVREGLALRISQGPTDVALVLPRGFVALDKAGLVPLDAADRDMLVFQARQRAGLPLPIIKELEALNRYATPWLNVTVTTRKVQPAEPAAARVVPGLIGDEFSRQLREATAADAAKTELERDDARGLFEADEGETQVPADDHAEAQRLALIKAATKTPEQMLNLAASMPGGALDLAMEPLERLRVEDDFAWQDAPTDVLSEHLVEAVSNGDVLAVIGLAAALFLRGGDLFSKRAMLNTWDQRMAGGAAPFRSEPLLAIRPGDLLHKGTEATRFRVLERLEDASSYHSQQPEPVFQVQPIRNGKDYGGPEELRLGSVVGFAPKAASK